MRTRGLWWRLLAWIALAAIWSAPLAGAGPGRAGATAQRNCHAKITGNVQTSKVKPTMTRHHLYPLQPPWDQEHQTIICLIGKSRPSLKASLLRAHPKG
jgi:hypothetical protein